MSPHDTSLETWWALLFLQKCRQITMIESMIWPHLRIFGSSGLLIFWGVVFPSEAGLVSNIICFYFHASYWISYALVVNVVEFQLAFTPGFSPVVVQFTIYFEIKSLAEGFCGLLSVSSSFAVEIVLFFPYSVLLQSCSWGLSVSEMLLSVRVCPKIEREEFL